MLQRQIEPDACIKSKARTVISPVTFTELIQSQKQDLLFHQETPLPSENSVLL